jgi:cyanophycinase
MASAGQGEPICMTGVRLHILTNGGTFDLHSRVATAPAIARD